MWFLAKLVKCHVEPILSTCFPAIFMSFTSTLLGGLFHYFSACMSCDIHPQSKACLLILLLVNSYEFMFSVSISVLISPC